MYVTDGHTVRIWHILYAYDIYVPYVYGIKYACSIERQDVQSARLARDLNYIAREMLGIIMYN